MFVHIKRLLREGALNPTIVNTYEESYPPFPLPSITLDPIYICFDKDLNIVKSILSKLINQPPNHCHLDH